MMSLQSEIINWYHQHKRDLPWRKTTDAYVIWLSEIILQQTRVEQGLPYFNKFLENFPTVRDFANASEEYVLKLWQGLGYYSRGRNMLHTAKAVMQNHNGVFPTAYADLLRLKGVGAYTAAAISSFSSNEKQAVLDGNVYRVLARYFGIHQPINDAKSQRTFTDLAKTLIEDQAPAIYNQAMMEFGALQCKPKSPNCGGCPLVLSCAAYATQSVGILPIKLKKVKIRERWFNYFVATDGEHILTKQRGAKDIWQNMYDFPQLETDGQWNYTAEGALDELKNVFGKDLEIRFLYQKKHLLTHQTIYVQFFAIDNYITNFNIETGIKSVEINAFKQLPHPIIIGEFIEKLIH